MLSLVVVCICTFLLSGCSFVWITENGDPATPEDIKSSVEKEFSVVHPRLFLQSAVVEKEKLLFAKRGREQNESPVFDMF